MRDGRLVTLQGKLYRVKVYSQLTAIGAVYTITSKQTHLHAVYDDRFAGRVSWWPWHLTDHRGQGLCGAGYILVVRPTLILEQLHLHRSLTTL